MGVYFQTKFARRERKHNANMRRLARRALRHAPSTLLAGLEAALGFEIKPWVLGLHGSTRATFLGHQFVEPRWNGIDGRDLARTHSNLF